MDDVIHRCRTVHEHLAAARMLSQELKDLLTTQHVQRTALEHQIEEYYQQAYDTSNLSC